MNTNHKTLAIALLALIIGFSLCYLVTNESEESDDITDMHEMSDGSMMHDGENMQSMMEGMMGELEGKTGDAFDMAFIDEMIVHHEGAVVMAELALTNAGHQEIKDLANDIILAQTKEIEMMKEWKATWFK